MRRVYSVINIRDADLNKVLKYLEQHRYKDLYDSYLYRYVKGWDNAPSRCYLHYLCLNETRKTYRWTSTYDSLFEDTVQVNRYNSLKDYLSSYGRYEI